MKINAKTMKWTRAPKQYTIMEDKVEMITEPFTDLWQKTHHLKQPSQIWKLQNMACTRWSTT